MILSLWQGWDGYDWVNWWKYIYTYDVNNNRIEFLTQDWDGSNWVNTDRYTYTYDGNNNMIVELWQEWDSPDWVNVWKWTYTYDGNNNMIENLKQMWLDSNWVNNEMFTYSYIPTGIEQLADGIETYSLSNNYPNPFNPTTKIIYQIPELSFITLKVYDVLGNEVVTLINKEMQTGKYEVEFDATSLSSGIYFYRIQTSSFRDTKKMVLLK